MNEIFLHGCTPTPLSHYLKALGILRLVSDQADAGARGHWQDEVFVLTTDLDAAELERFFLEAYRPTPILAPWNGGSGFYFQEEKLKEKDPKTGKRIKTGRRNQPTQATRAIDKVSTSHTDRFKALRQLIDFSKQFLVQQRIDQAPEAGDRKQSFITHFRSTAPEIFLSWLDAAVVLTGDDPAYPPLLGTGGNDGNLDFTNNFIQRLIELVDPTTGKPKHESHRLLKGALFAEPIPGLDSAAIGQFSPGAAGGPNATTGFERDSLINAWDFVLMLEGAILFAATVTRKHLSAGPGVLSYPFTVRPTGSGSGAAALADESPARAEMWLPLWKHPTLCDELRVLFGEGRISLGTRPVRDGLEVVRALAHLGVARGIAAFQRYAFMMRSGKAYLATPLNRIPVKRNPAADLLDELDRRNWLTYFRRMARNKDRPGRVATLARRLEDAMFDMARESRPDRVQAVLVALGAIQRYLATNPTRRAECQPVPSLSRGWMLQANDASPEFRIAAALASLHGEIHRRQDNETGQQLKPCLPMAVHMAPIDQLNRQAWDEGSRLVTWSEGSLHDNLFVTAQRRLLAAEQQQLPDKPFAGSPLASAGDIAAFLADDLDESRITRLLVGLSLARAPDYFPGTHTQYAPLPAAYILLRLLFATHTQLRESELLAPDQTLPLPPRLLRLLYAGRLSGPQGALAVGAHRRSASGLPSVFATSQAPGTSGPRLLSALLIPIHDADLRRLHERTRPPPSKATTA